MKYRAVIQPAGGSRTRAITLGYTDDCDLFIIDIGGLAYNYMSFSTPTTLAIVGFYEHTNALTGFNTKPEDIQSGDLVRIFEDDRIIFNGYVLTPDYEFSGSGRIMYLTIDTLLSHFTRQNAIQSYQQVSALLGPEITESVFTLEPDKVQVFNTDMNSNRVPLGSLIKFLMEQSVYTYAKNFSDFRVIYKDPDVINANTLVWYYASTQSTKAEVLRDALKYFQVIAYQDPEGNLVIGLPNEREASSYVIESGDPYGKASYTFRRLRRSRSEATLPNNVVASLVYLGIYPPVGSTIPPNVVSQCLPEIRYFPRSFELFNTGYFSQNLLTVANLSNDISTSPLLLDLVSKIPNYRNPMNSERSQLSMAPLLAARALAESLTNSDVMYLELNRNDSNFEIPIGKTFSIDQKVYFCIECEISLSIDMGGGKVENVLKLTGAPLRSITGLWSTNPSP